MLRAGVGVSVQGEGRAAAEEAAATALETAGLERAEAAVLVATADRAEALEELLPRALAVLGTEAVVGATVHGVLASGREHPSGALGVLALGGIEARTFLLPELPPGALGEEIAAELPSPPGERDLAVLLPDPRSVEPRAWIRGLREALAPATIVGAGAMAAAGTPPLLWCGPEIARRGVAGLLLRAGAPPRTAVTQSCQPVTELLAVTRSEGHWVLELEGRPALDVYRDVARGPLAADLRRAAGFLLVALPREPGAALRPGGYLVRHVAGFDESRRAFALPEPARRGMPLALALRDAESARQDLKQVLAAAASPPPAFGLYFDCCARGAALFGVPDLEAAYLASALGEAPLLGLFGSFELGPIGGALELLTYTGVLALIDA